MPYSKEKDSRKTGGRKKVVSNKGDRPGVMWVNTG